MTGSITVRTTVRTVRRLASGVVVVVLLAHLACPASTYADVNYVYDALGRLIAVIDEQGDVAVYSYDAVGNLLSISR